MHFESLSDFLPWVAMRHTYGARSALLFINAYPSNHQSTSR